MSYRRARFGELLLFLVIGVLARDWITAAVAAFFLYVALTVMGVNASQRAAKAAPVSSEAS